MRNTSQILTGGLFALLAMVCLAPAGVRADVVVGDSFTDGDFTSSPTWYRMYSSTPGPLAVATDTGGLGDDPALWINSTVQYDSFFTTFADTTLDQAGKFIRFSFQMRIQTGYDPYDYRDTFRFGIWNNQGTPVVADAPLGASHPTTDDKGYVVSMATGDPPPTNTRDRIAFNPGGSASSGGPFRISGSPTVETLLMNVPAKFPLNDWSPHTIALTLTRSASATLLITLTIDGVALMSCEDNSATYDPVMTFNQIGLTSVYNPPLKYIVDDVLVETGAVPACQIVPPVYVRTGVAKDQTTVTVAGVSSSASEIKVYADGVLINNPASQPLPSPAPASVDVTVTPLVGGQELTAFQVVGGVESCFPPGASPIVSPSPAIEVVVDGFGDGSRKNNGAEPGALVDDENDVGVPFFLGNSGSQFVSIVHDLADPDGLGVDNVISVDASGGPGTEAYLVANFTNVALDKPGEFIKLSFDIRLTNVIADRNSFRFGLFNSNGSQATDDVLYAPDVFDNDSGYFSTVATAVGQFQHLYRADANVGTFMSLDGGGLPGQPTPDAYMMTNTSPRKLALTLMRTSLGVTVTYEVDGLAPWIQSDNSSTPVLNFDEVGFGVLVAGGTEPNDYMIDNVRIVTAGNVCAAAVFDADGSNKIDAFDLQIFEACATGPTPSADVFNGRSQPCKCMDINKDNAIDQQDFGVFQKCFSGPATLDASCDDTE